MHDNISVLLLTHCSVNIRQSNKYCQRCFSVVLSTLNGRYKHMSAQLSFSTKYQRWNNVWLTTLKQRNSINVVSALSCFDGRTHSLNKFH